VGLPFPTAPITAAADYLPWLLSALGQDATANGRRLLDVFTVHYYPQGGEFSDDVSTRCNLRRNRSTRSLWDPAYATNVDQRPRSAGAAPQETG